MNCNTSVWPSESLHCGKRDPIRPWKRVLMNGERASPFGPMLSYIYIPNSKPYTRIVLPHRERYRCFRFLFSPFFSFFFSFPPLAFQPASHQIEQFSRCSCSPPRYSSPRLFSTFHDSSKIPSQPLNHSHLEILNYRIISRERIQKLSNPIDYAYSSKDCSTVKKKKERKKETAMKVSNSTPPRCLEKGGKRGGHSLDSLEKVSGVREKEETHGEIGVRKGVERCCKTERRGGENGAEGGRESKEGLNGDGERGGEVRRGKTDRGYI